MMSRVRSSSKGMATTSSLLKKNRFTATSAAGNCQIFAGSNGLSEEAWCLCGECHIRLTETLQ